MGQIILNDAKQNFQKWCGQQTEDVMLCTNRLRQMGLPTRGRRCQLGSLLGPMNNECMNGTHPAMLAAQRCKYDVQLPYRFLIIKESHCCFHDGC